MSSAAVILARGGSKGLPRKNALPIGGKPMLAWTIEHAVNTPGLDRVLVSTDDDRLMRVARDYPVELVERPDALASDTATVDAAARHAVEGIDADHIAILYGNIPVRPADLTRRALDKLIETGCDSVQSVCPVGKMHPYWMKRLDGDRLLMYEANTVYRRQDLPPVYMLDGGVIAVTRASLMTVTEGEPHAFLGRDRRAVTTRSGEVVDVDSWMDLKIAEATMGKMADG